jgi:hypothetical protein
LLFTSSADYQGPKAGNRSGAPRWSKTLQPDHQKKTVGKFRSSASGSPSDGDWEPETGRLINQSKEWELGLAMSMLSANGTVTCAMPVYRLCASPQCTCTSAFTHKGKNYDNEKGICEKKRQNISKRNGED